MSLVADINIRSWLLCVANNKLCEYFKKSKIDNKCVSIDDVEIPVFDSYEHDEIDIDEIFDDVQKKILNMLNDKEKELFDEIKLTVVNSLEMSEIKSFEDIYYFLSSGFAIVIIDGVSCALALGIQGFEKRSVDEPSNEANIKGAKIIRQCFTEE